MALASFALRQTTPPLKRPIHKQPLLHAHHRQLFRIHRNEVKKTDAQNQPAETDLVSLREAQHMMLRPVLVSSGAPAQCEPPGHQFIMFIKAVERELYAAGLSQKPASDSGYDSLMVGVYASKGTGRNVKDTLAWRDEESRATNPTVLKLVFCFVATFALTRDFRTGHSRTSFG